MLLCCITGVFTDALNSSHFLCIGSLRRFQDGDNGAIRILASDGSEDGFIVGRETVYAIVLAIADDCQVIIHIIIQSHCPDITSIRCVATHRDVGYRYFTFVDGSEICLQLLKPLLTFCLCSNTCTY